MRDDSTSETGSVDPAAPVPLAPAAGSGASVFDGWSPRTDAFGAVANDDPATLPQQCQKTTPIGGRTSWT